MQKIQNTPRIKIPQEKIRVGHIDDEQFAANCIKHFYWLMELFWPIRFEVTIVSIGNNCNVKPDWQNHHLEQL